MQEDQSTLTCTALWHKNSPRRFLTHSFHCGVALSFCIFRGFFNMGKKKKKEENLCFVLFSHLSSPQSPLHSVEKAPYLSVRHTAHGPYSQTYGPILWCTDVAIAGFSLLYHSDLSSPCYKFCFSDWIHLKLHRYDFLNTSEMMFGNSSPCLSKKLQS